MTGYKRMRRQHQKVLIQVRAPTLHSYGAVMPCSHLTSAFAFASNSRMGSMATSDGVHIWAFAFGGKDQRKTQTLRARLHQASTLRQHATCLRFCSHWKPWSRLKMGCNPILEWLHCFQWEKNRKRHCSVVEALTLMLGIVWTRLYAECTTESLIISRNYRCSYETWPRKILKMMAVTVCMEPAINISDFANKVYTQWIDRKAEVVCCLNSSM